MTGAAVAGSIVFVIGYLFITFEHQLKMQKAPTSLVMAGLLWWLVSRQTTDFQHHLEEGGWEITQIVFFLLFAMALIELITRLGFFELVRVELQERNWGNKRQFVVLAVLTFFFSAMLDNLTTAIVMVEICRRFFKGKNLLVAASGVVVLANAGGAWSPIGDVTTIMLWLAGKFTAGEVVSNVFLPSVAHGVVATGLLSKAIKDESYDDSEENLPLSFTLEAKVVMTASLLCFTLPFVATQFDLPPFIGLGFGFGVVAVLFSLIGQRVQYPHGEVEGRTTHLTRMEHDIQEVLREVDFSSLIFFVGILLSVAALDSLGVLEEVSHSVFGSEPSFPRVAAGSVLLGWGSAIVDNVPLTAVAIDTIPTSDPGIWSLLAYTVGTGGSHLIIGSAAGVVVMGRVNALTSLAYMRIAALPVLVAYLAGVMVWVAQILVFRG